MEDTTRNTPVVIRWGWSNTAQCNTVAWKYHPEFLSAWRKTVHYPEVKYDPANRCWEIHEEGIIWRELEWLGEEFEFRCY